MGDVLAYTIDHGPKVNFCPRFFTLPGLHQKMDEMELEPLRKRGFVYKYLNKGIFSSNGPEFYELSFDRFADYYTSFIALV